MGFFDNIKKKNEAKQLGLSVEEYDGFLQAKEKGISLDQYKRFLSDFAGKISMEQFVDYLKLEQAGMTEAQAMRFSTELSAKIKVEDYADFLEAEQLGLSLGEYVAYSNTLKGKMSAVDYVGFLKAQKIGFTLGKYLQYLKSFKGEMSLEEYDTYLKAEANGLDREHYTEYLREYKDMFSVERYMEFDKARSLGMTLEEYDLRIEASKLGMSVEQFENHKAVEKLGITDEEYNMHLQLLNNGAISGDILSIPADMMELPQNVFRLLSFKKIKFHSGITKIKDGVFADCKELETVEIPEHIKKIGEEAFKGCVSLKSVSIADGVEEIEDAAFEGCSLIVEMFIPRSVKTVGYHAFYGCTALEKLEFEYGVEDIDVSDWVDLPALSTVITPASASISYMSIYKKDDPRYAVINKDEDRRKSSETKIDYIIPSKYYEYGIGDNQDEIEFLEIKGDYAFIDLADFENLKAVYISAKGCVRSIENCPQLQMILYHNFIAEIPSRTVSSEKEREDKIIASKTLTVNNYDAPSLRFLCANDGAMVVDLDNSFGFNLAWLHIPSFCSRIGLNTSVISKVAIHGNCKILSKALDSAELEVIRFDNDSRKDGLYSNSTTDVIMSAALLSCRLLDLRFARENFNSELFGVQSAVSSIRLPDNLKTIGDNAFEKWGITSIVIPSSVEAIGNNVFKDCSELKSVCFECVPESIGYDLFAGASSVATITIEGETLTVSEFVEKYESEKPVIIEAVEVKDADETHEELEENGILDETGINETSQAEVLSDMCLVSFESEVNIYLPSNCIYSTDADIIGENRVLVAVLDDADTDLSNPYASAESITVLRGKDITSIEDADTIAASIGLSDETIIIDNESLNVRYALKESSDNLTIYLALICTSEHSYPTQFFFNNKDASKAELTVINVLSSMSLIVSDDADEFSDEDENEDVATTLEEKDEIKTDDAYEAVKNPTEKVAQIHTVAQDLTGVLYTPGNEPENIKKRISTLFEKLDSAYPDKVIVGLHKEHKKWGETVTDLYRKLGYPSGNAFLSAYGYTVAENTGGRPTVDNTWIIDELKKRYPDGPVYERFIDLKEANPDLKFATLNKDAQKLFGMPLGQYLIQEGLLKGVLKSESKTVFETLKSRYETGPFVGTLKELQSANPDLDWRLIEKYCILEKGMRLKPFLEDCGILSGNDDADRLAAIEESIKAKYANATVRAATLSEFEKENPDINRGVLNRLTMSVYNESASDYLKRLGVISADSAEEKLARVMVTLKERYADGKMKAFSITDLREQNFDLPISTIGTWTKKLYNKNATEYLSEQGILSVYDWRLAEQVRREREESEKQRARQREEERLKQELETPIETIYYTPKIYEIEEVSVSGKEAELWETDEYWASHPGEIFIKDYLGDASRVTIPTYINGKRVSNLDSFALKKCKASIVEIPGSFEHVAGHLGYENTNIKTVIIGEGVKGIGESCFSFVNSLKNVCVSQSVIEVGRTAFEYTPWFESQRDYVIIGSVLVKMKGDGAVLNVPHGVKAVGELVAVFNNRLRKVILPETVTTLYPRAFSGRGNENIQEFVFTNSLVNIGHRAFGANKWTAQFEGKPMIINNQLCSYETAEGVVIIPDGVVKICDEAFKENDKLRKVVLPDSVKTLGAEAFSRCKNLTTINLPDGIERLELGCFYDCKKLTNITIPDSVIYIGRSAFNSCAALINFRIGNGVEFVGEKAFLDCKNLVSVEMNEKIRDIQREAFSGCSALTHITIPAGVSELKEYIFNKCKSLVKVECLGKITAIGRWAFYECEALEEITLPCSIGESSFYGCTNLRKVVFEDGITEIPNECFAKCISLEEVILPDSVVKIGANAFSGCTGIKKLILSATLKEIGESAFEGCSSIESIVILDAVETISDNAFKDCTKLLNVTMPSTITNFGLDVFTNTPYMKKEFGDYVVIGGLLTKYLGTEKEVVIPDNVTIIGKNSFAEAYHVESIVMHDHVVKIEDQVYGEVYSWGDEGQPKLQKLVIGNGVTTIGKKAFANCVELSEIAFGESIVEIEEEAFEGCKSVKSIDLSRTPVVRVGSSAFSGLCNVDALLLPETIEYIERDAFASIYIDKLQLPKSVKKVERGAFSNVNELVVYDCIDPDAAEASAWNYSEWNGSVNSPLACAMLSVSGSYIECQGNTGWRDYHITVLSETTGEVRYRIFCDSEEREDYRAIMFSAWGKNATFMFDKYDEYFLKTRHPEGRIEMAFCRLQHQEGLSVDHKENYEAFLERCMYIERSARRTAKSIAKTDDTNRLKMLFDYNTIDEHNIDWVREEFEKAKANNCTKFLNEKVTR